MLKITAISTYSLLSEVGDVAGGTVFPSLMTTKGATALSGGVGAAGVVGGGKIFESTMTLKGES